MTKASDNAFPKVILEEVLTDGSATTTPAADYRSLFLGEDGALHLKDSAAAVTDVGGTGGAVDPIETLFGAPDTAFEFDTNSLTGLTAIGAPDVENADTTVPDALYYKDDTATTAFMGRYLASPSMPFTVITRILDCIMRANYNTAGLIVGVADPTTGAFVTCSMQSNTGRSTAEPRVVAAEKMTNRTTYASDQAADVAVGPGTSIYLAMVVNSTTSIDYYWSLNGWVWCKFGSAVNPSLTVGSVGLAMRSESAAPFSVAFDFLRIWNSALTFPG